MADVKCPVCGQNNPSDAESCRNCFSPLQSVPDAIQPGEFPTKKVTAELEPILPAWLREARDKSRQTGEDDLNEPAIPAPASSSDLLTGLRSQAGDEDDEVPDWLAGITGESGKKKAAPEAGETHWVELGGAQENKPAAQTEPEPAKPDESGLPSWLANLSASEPPLETGTSQGAVGTSAEAQVPPAGAESSNDWLTGLQAEASAPVEPAASTESFGEVELPAWMKSDEPAAPNSTSTSAFGDDLPNWLKNTNAADEKPAAPDAPSGLGAGAVAAGTAAAFTELPPEVSAAAETPDWLSNLGSAPASKPSASSLIPENSQAVFTEPPMDSGGLDALFTDVPDWLSKVTSSSPAATEPPAAPAEGTDGSLSPASLPSWVQAMRPVEASLGAAARNAAGDEAMETRGALAGLQGVLPAAATFGGASSKPKAQSSKPQTDEEQQSQAALLDQILAAEARPEPMSTPPQLASQRALRISIGLLLFALLAAAVFAGTQFFPLPLGRPNETMAAFGVVDAIIPPDAPVLVVFDYEPALAGEMEAVAAPLLDHLIIKQHPRLALISTSPTGAMLAERLLAGPLGELKYQDGVQYADLGYLPGGVSGVRGFAEDPLHTSLFTADISVFNLDPPSVWQSAPLQGVQAFSDFAAVILITDSAESGRAWIEQAGPLRGSTTQFVVVSSAQAAPMLLPYYQAGQISGLASGLYDASVLEQNNANRPGLARRYWDAYNLGLMLAVVLLVGGALWNWAAGLRERAAAKEAG